jgi:hypothetical protein
VWAFIVADNADYSPDYLAHVRSPANRSMSAVGRRRRAVHADQLTVPLEFEFPDRDPGYR